MRIIKNMRWPYYTFYSGTVTLREIGAVLVAFIRREPLYEGKYINQFEAKFADYLGVSNAFSFGAGRMALYVILEALGIGPGDEVILPAYTCVVVPNAVIYRGAKLVYVDIDRKTLNIDVDKIEDKITQRTRAIMAQHTFGLPCDMDPILAIARKHQLVVIEDCCLALGAEYKGKKVGGFGNAAFFSFDNSKVISTELGGMIVTNDRELAKKIGNIQSKTPFFSKSSILKQLLQFILGTVSYFPLFYFIGRYLMAVWYRSPFKFQLTDENMIKKPKQYPYPARLSNIQAKVGLSQLKGIEKNIAHRIKIAKTYDDFFKGMANVESVNRPPSDDYKHIYLRFTVLSDNPQKWIKKYEKWLEIGTWFDSIAHGRYERLEEIGYSQGSCPVGEEVVKKNINFLTHLRVKRIAGIFKEVT